MSKTISPYIIVGGVAAAYLLLKPASTTVPGTVPATGLSSLLPGATSQVPTTYGINSGLKGGNGSFYTVANYQQLLIANPNLGNPNYQLSASELAQYLANYLDLQQGLPTWIGEHNAAGQLISTLQQAEQAHWNLHGCAEQRIFLPLQPPSTGSYVPPPPAPVAAKKSGSSWISSAVNIAGSVALALLGNQTTKDYVLTDGDWQTIVAGAAISKKILPLYLQVDPNLVASISNKIDSVLSDYQN